MEPVVGFCEALYDFEGTQEGDLDLREGEIITITRKNERWWQGVTADGRSGIFPSNYVAEIHQPTYPAAQAAPQVSILS